MKTTEERLAEAEKLIDRFLDADYNQTPIDLIGDMISFRGNDYVPDESLKSNSHAPINIELLQEVKEMFRDAMIDIDLAMIRIESVYPRAELTPGEVQEIYDSGSTLHFKLKELIDRIGAWIYQ